MTAIILDLARERERRQPHQVGPAFCTRCAHEWVQVALIGVDDLDCPRCGGLGMFHVEHLDSKDPWICPCGCGLFRLSAAGVACAKCGETMAY